MNQPDQAEKSKNSGISIHKLIFVLLFVLIFCGGNGAGILVGALLWKVTGRAAPAVTALVVITVIAFALAMVMTTLYLRGIAADAAARSQENENPDAAEEGGNAAESAVRETDEKGSERE